MFPKFEFAMDIPNAPVNALIYGKLILRDDDKNISFMATSGIARYQYFGGWKVPRRGLIPNRQNFSVSTQRLWLPHVKGVEGSFYAISPFTVNADGVTRGDFGVHFDANVPGSAGCIVIKQQDHWDTFRKTMEEYNALRIKSIPLEVKYV